MAPTIQILALSSSLYFIRIFIPSVGSLKKSDKLVGSKVFGSPSTVMPITHPQPSSPVRLCISPSVLLLNNGSWQDEKMIVRNRTAYFIIWCSSTFSKSIENKPNANFSRLDNVKRGMVLLLSSIISTHHFSYQYHLTKVVVALLYDSF